MLASEYIHHQKPGGLGSSTHESLDGSCDCVARWLYVSMTVVLQALSWVEENSSADADHAAGEILMQLTSLMYIWFLTKCTICVWCTDLLARAGTSDSRLCDAANGTCCAPNVDTQQKHNSSS